MQNFFHENYQDPNGLTSRLETSCEGLVLISETDAPVIPFAGGPTDEVNRSNHLTANR